MTFPVIFRGNAEKIFESSAEVVAIHIAEFHGSLRDGKIFGEHFVSGLMEFEVFQIIFREHPGMFEKFPSQSARRNAPQFCQFIYAPPVIFRSIADRFEQGFHGR